MSIQEVNDQTFEHKISKNGVTVVEFGAPWCPPCKVLYPIIEELDAKYNNQLTVLTINSDDSPQLAAAYGVMSLPTVIVFNEAEPVEKLVGLRPLAVYEQIVDRHLA